MGLEPLIEQFPLLEGLDLCLKSFGVRAGTVNLLPVCMRIWQQGT
jgi:hypothetical protein